MKVRNRLLSLLLALAMLLAMVPAVLAGDEEPATLPAGATLTQGSITASVVTMSVGQTGVKIQPTCSEASHEGETDQHTFTFTKKSGDNISVAADGTLTATAAGSTAAVVTVTCACGATADVNVTVTKAKISLGVLSNFNMASSAGQTAETIKASLTTLLRLELDKLTNGDKIEIGTWEDGTNTGEFATVSATDKGEWNFKTTLSLKTDAADNYEFTTVNNFSAKVTFYQKPVLTITTQPTAVTCQQNETGKTVSVGVTKAPNDDDTVVSYQWYYSAYADGSSATAVAEAKGGKTATCQIDTATAGTRYYFCKINATRPLGMTEADEVVSNKVKVEVVSPLRVTFTKTTTTTNSVGSRIGYLATVQKWDDTNKQYVTATAGTDFYKLTFESSNTGLATVPTNYSLATANTAYVYLDCKAVGTVSLKANIYKTLSSSTPEHTSSESVSISAASVPNVTMNPSGSYAVIDMSQLSTAVYNATYNSNLVSGISPTSITFSGNGYGTFTTSNSTTSVSSLTHSTSSSYAVYFTPTSSYANFSNANMYISYTAYYNSGTIATGKIYFTAASSITYSTTASTQVSFSYNDFLDFYRKSTYSSATLNYISITGAPYVASGTGTLGTLYYNSYAYSTTSSYYNSYFTNISASYASYLSYTPSSSLTKYTVNIPFTLSGSSGSVSGYVTIKVNDGHTIGMTGTSFKSAGIWSDITATYPSASYVMFTQPSTSVGRLYYGYTSIASKGTAVSYLDKFNNTSYATSYASSYKSIDSVYFVPAADCLSTITLTYTAYNASGYSIGSSTITFTVTQKTASYWFNDITASNTGSWSADAIDFLAANSIVKGSSSGTFDPNGYMTRGDFVLMLYRAAGEPSVSGISNPFTDVKSSDYYYKAILWAYKNNIVTGNTTTTFAPKQNITREQIAATLYRMAGSPSTSGSVSGYYDSSKIHSYALSAMKWAVGNGILAGSNGYLTPANNATRAQVSTMLHRYLTK